MPSWKAWVQSPSGPIKMREKVPSALIGVCKSNFN